MFSRAFSSSSVQQAARTIATPKILQMRNIKTCTQVFTNWCTKYAKCLRIRPCLSSFYHPFSLPFHTFTFYFSHLSHHQITHLLSFSLAEAVFRPFFSSHYRPILLAFFFTSGFIKFSLQCFPFLSCLALIFFFFPQKKIKTAKKQSRFSFYISRRKEKRKGIKPHYLVSIITQKKS